MCASCAVENLGLLVPSLLHTVRTCETWNYVEYSSPLIYDTYEPNRSSHKLVKLFKLYKLSC